MSESSVHLPVGPATDMLLLGGDNPTTWIVYNELVSHFGLFPAVIEDGVSRRVLLRNRVRKLGFLPVLAQVGFITLVRPVLNWTSRTRLRYLARRDGLETTMPVTKAISHVPSINGPEAHALIVRLRPRIVIVNGTRILSKATLAKTNATVINTHQGITPQYRGAHGAYWALRKKDPQKCGVTIHLVDEGIDTGNILAQEIIESGPHDNFLTYPYLQTAAALDHIVASIEAARAGTLQSKPVTGASGVWYHPGLFGYLAGAIQGVR